MGLASLGEVLVRFDRGDRRVSIMLGRHHPCGGSNSISSTISQIR
jgi:hypothetical protein